MWDGLTWPIPDSDRIRPPLCWEKLNHTKDNKLDNTRKLDWVLYEQWCISLSLLCRIGIEQTNLGIYWSIPNGSSWFIFFLMTLVILLAILLVFCLFYKIVVSCITNVWLCFDKMMTRQLEAADQLYSSIWDLWL